MVLAPVKQVQQQRNGTLPFCSKPIQLMLRIGLLARCFFHQLKLGKRCKVLAQHLAREEMVFVLIVIHHRILNPVFQRIKAQWPIL